ncbi:unnamed protein product [Cylicocyclus nassatus]|uniref:SXP/RAL-2 family protein Ani s 5-like cation-binding domain-containing protein n=1 Tax=Cylicocyclus nassatus TaxID=53992 RepID=A0AA36GJK6_CYLNA|nr:unnamed protein product [Cylicocyclus nassatus]
MRLIAFLALFIIARCRRSSRYKTWRADQYSQTFRNLRSSPEFIKITKSLSMTVGQQKQALRDLASRNRVLGEMEDYIEASDAKLRQMKAKTQKIAEELPRGLQEYWKIMEYPYQTAVEKHYALKKIKLQNPALFEVINFMVDSKKQCPTKKMKTGERSGRFDSSEKNTPRGNPYQKVRYINPLVLSETRDHRNRIDTGRGSSHGTSMFMGTSYDFDMDGLTYLR